MMDCIFPFVSFTKPLEIRKHQVNKNYLSLKTNNPKTLELAALHISEREWKLLIGTVDKTYY